MKKKSPEDTREEVGRRGGKARVPKGFAKMNPSQRKKAARKGGKEKARRARQTEP